jgi:hypothetical protein
VHSFTRFVFLTFAITALALASGTSAFAQQTGGLFGATRSDAADRDHLNVAIMLAEAFDTELPPYALAQASQVTPQSGGLSTMAIGTANYAHTRRRARIAATAQTSFRYFGNIERVDPIGHSGGVGANIQLTRIANLQLDQSAAYSPSYLYNLIPSTTPPILGDTIETAPDFQVVHEDSYSYRSSVTLAIGGTDRGPSVHVGGGYDRTRYLSERTDRPRLSTYNGRTTFTQHLRRNLGLSAEYEYRTGDYGIGPATEHRVSVGADYTRRLSTSRRATFRFNVGRSLLDVPELSVDGATNGRVDRTSGDASVTYELRRGWQVSANVRRSVEYTPLFREPVLSDGASLSLTSQVTRRWDISASAGYANGASALNERNTLKTYVGDVMARFALKRWVALYGEYVYFYYDLSGRERLVPNLPTQFEQHGIRIGVALWASPF